MTTTLIETVLPLLAAGVLVSPLVVLMERTDRRVRRLHGTATAHDVDTPDTRRVEAELRVLRVLRGTSATPTTGSTQRRRPSSHPSRTPASPTPRYGA